MRDRSQAETQRIDDLKQRLEKDPASRIFFDLAREYHEAGRFQEAAETCSKGLRQHQSYLSARVLLGRIYFDMGRADDAREQMETSLQQAPDNLVARRVLAQICLEQGDFAGALERYRALLAFSPTDAEAAARIVQIERRLSAEELSLESEPLRAEAAVAAPPSAPGPVAAPEAKPAEPAGSSPGDLPHQAEAAGRLQRRRQPPQVRPVEPTRSAPAPPPADEPTPTLAGEEEVLVVVEAPREIFVEVVSEAAGVADLGLEPGVLATPTLAEIYLDQGLTEKAAQVYREILQGDPGNTEALARIAEIERAQAPGTDSRTDSARRRIQALSTWLEVIRGASRV